MNNHRKLFRRKSQRRRNILFFVKQNILSKYLFLEKDALQAFYAFPPNDFKVGMSYLSLLNFLSYCKTFLHGRLNQGQQNVLHFPYCWENKCPKQINKFAYINWLRLLQCWHWVRGHSKTTFTFFGRFWPPTYPLLTIVDIWATTYLLSTLTLQKIPSSNLPLPCTSF